MGLAYVPCWSSVVSFGIVVDTISVTSEEEHLVLSIHRSITVQLGDLIGESLPLCFGALRIIGCVCGVGLVDQTEVGGSLVSAVSHRWQKSCGEKLPT